MRVKSWDETENLLCIRLDAMGDVLMSEPALRALKESRPGRRITLLTSEAGVAAARMISSVDEVLAYDAPWLKATARREASEPELRQIRMLKERGFDGAVIFTVYSQNPLPSAFLCYLADIPLRVAHCRENPYQLLTHWVPESEPQQRIRHEVRRQLDLVATIGARVSDERMSLCIPESAADRVLRRLHEKGVELFHPWVVIHPGASAPSRRYPPERYARVAQALVEEHGHEVVFTGTDQERALIEGIRSELRVPTHSLAGELGLEELAALLTAAPILISNNTGAAHVAAACGTPVVDLYALTNPQHTPWRVPHRLLYEDVPCRYCYKSVCPQIHNHCLSKVAPERVVLAAIELLNEVRDGTGRDPQGLPSLTSLSTPSGGEGLSCTL